MKTLIACASALALFATAQAARAQSAPEVSYDLAVVTDYVFRGISQTDDSAAVQGGISMASGGFYAGAWASTVDFGDDTDAEVDFYGGYTTQIAGFDVDVGAVVYLYVGKPAGADYDFIELKAAASRSIGPVSLGVATFYSPNFFGVDDEAFYYEANSAYAFSPSLTASGAVGHQSLDVSDDYTTWNAGLTYALTSLVSIDVRYHDTDTAGPLSEERVVGMLSLAF
ncbi:TorF family putative porin [Brevundimonas poindexterae]|uniref:TorF family putative porin n=1 Tax=Brevundimonas poindexterae TaxID=74325 RepID=UPI001CFE925D|nr:TorF family putative porin [Brevundimonas poindexterae]